MTRQAFFGRRHRSRRSSAECRAARTTSTPGAVAAAIVAFFLAGNAKAQDGVRTVFPTMVDFVERIEVRGNSRTQESTLLDLLPRRPPARLTDGELMEIERRIANLEIFDQVAVTRDGRTVIIDVREKWTLIPSFDFATGKTAADTYVALGATEFNFRGTAAQLGVSAEHEERGWSFAAAFSQHEYHPRRWSTGVEAHHVTASYRFDDPNQGWYRQSSGGSIGWSAPMRVGSFIRYMVGASYDRETIADVSSPPRPAGGHAVGSFMMFTWDRYTWNDLAPSGHKMRLSIEPGWLLGPDIPQKRYAARASLTAALPLAKYTILALRAAGDVGTTGNPNHSSLLGSVQGVRGLEDAFYRNWAQTYANVELRQGVSLAPRWALQGVLFSDAAAFERLDVDGRRGERLSALNVGFGLRVVPTFLARLLLRVDVARLVLPEERWFVQLGVSQYF